MDSDVYEWAVRECGGIERIRRGMEFDAFPVGIVLDGTDGAEIAACKTADGEWDTQHYGAGPYPEDVRDYYISGRLVKRRDEAAVEPGWDGVSDFSEDDEPIADVLAAYEAGEPCITWPPDEPLRTVQGPGPVLRRGGIVNTEEAAAAARMLGEAYRGDSAGADGKQIRDDFDALANLIEGKMTMVDFIVATGLCSFGGSHWHDRDDCSEADCTPTRT